MPGDLILDYAPVKRNRESYWLSVLFSVLLLVVFIIGIVQQLFAFGSVGVSDWLFVSYMWDVFVFLRWVVFKATRSAKRDWALVYTSLHLTLIWWMPAIVRCLQAF